MTTPQTTHTPINLAPGLDLVIHADHSGNPVTFALVERCKALLDRVENVAEIKACVETLLDSDDESGLACIHDAMGWVDNWRDTSAKRKADAILALLDVCNDDRIIGARECADYAVRALYAEQQAACGASDASTE